MYEKVAQSVRAPHEAKDLNLVFSTQVKKSGVGVCTCNPGLGREISGTC